MSFKTKNSNKYMSEEYFTCLNNKTIEIVSSLIKFNIVERGAGSLGSIAYTVDVNMYTEFYLL